MYIRIQISNGAGGQQEYKPNMFVKAIQQCIIRFWIWIVLTITKKSYISLPDLGQNQDS